MPKKPSYRSARGTMRETRSDDINARVSRDERDAATAPKQRFTRIPRKRS